MDIKGFTNRMFGTTTPDAGKLKYRHWPDDALRDRMIAGQEKASAIYGNQANGGGGYLIPKATLGAELAQQNLNRPSTTINIQRVANGTLVILNSPTTYVGVPWERAWIVPEGESVTDVIAQALAVERLTNP